MTVQDLFIIARDEHLALALEFSISISRAHLQDPQRFCGCVGAVKERGKGMAFLFCEDQKN